MNTIDSAVTAQWVKELVYRLVDNHGWHFYIGKPLAAAIAKWSVLLPLSAGPHYTAAVLSVMTSLESSNQNHVIGDHGRSYCALQVQRCAPYKCEELVKDPDKCIEVGLRTMHESEEKCADSPLAIYAAGFCESKIGRKISHERLAKAEALLTTEDDVH